MEKAQERELWFRMRTLQFVRMSKERSGSPDAAAIVQDLSQQIEAVRVQIPPESYAEFAKLEMQAARKWTAQREAWMAEGKANPLRSV